MKSLLFSFILTFFCLQITHAQLYKIVKEAPWVKAVDIPKSQVAKYDLSSGYYLTLADYQINLDDNSYYRHEVIKVYSYSGITNASQLMVRFDTSFQKLKIHHLYIWRNGVKIDRTNNLSFEIMNNEYNLHQGIYMGKITAYDNLSDVRKDDLIDFAYTLIGKNPIFKNGKYLFIPLETSSPIDYYFTRILYSKNKNYTYNCEECDSTVKITSTSNATYREIEMEINGLKATSLEENIPDWIIPYKYFTLSSFKNWKDINIWAQGVFSLTTKPDLEPVFKEIFKGGETRDQKIDKIINFVQDDIRYMGIEAGIGSIKPASPDKVAKQRFGDCKDKSLLLVSLLKKIGIREAFPVLVNVSIRNGLTKFHPSNEIFDHCIVKFIVDSTTYWVDPTITQQGGNYKTMSLDDYGPALVIGQPSDSLVKIPYLDLRSAIHVEEALTVRSFTAPATLQINATRFGLDADRRRMALEHYSAVDITKAVSEDLSQIYQNVNQSADLIVKDDIDSNIISTIYQYDVEGFWKDGAKFSDKRLADFWIFRYEPQNLYEYLKLFTGNDRKFDYALPYPMNFNYRIVFNFPEDVLIEDKYIRNSNEAFFFDQKLKQINHRSFEITYNLKTKSSFIKANAYGDIVAEKNKIVKALPIIIYFNKTVK